ncbi:DNA-directed RNA polymerase I core subunit [Starmerella bacillaris]|uniref:DNA-directed RNA polymerase subunit n=1 Tax=Starmerella bacillaris TaxID=1247836 RepID=A0AAV5RNN6_STABA|nr:DNA-directed RNA polymerase I core subunit [Starmerella bacillaris]
MSVVGSLVFCVDCGTLLDKATQAELICGSCKRTYEAARFQNLEVVTESAPNAFPSALRAKRSAVKTTINSDELDEGAVIQETCPECGNDEMSFHTLQMRSADEGATVFYTCTACGYKFSQNN